MHPDFSGTVGIVGQHELSLVRIEDGVIFVITHILDKRLRL